MEVLHGRAHVFGDNINTDYIINSKYKAKTLNIDEMSRHLMEDIRPDFYTRLTKGDFVVGGKNFGSGSSREAAPLVIKAAGICAVLAKSFARIFFRNGINIGLPLFECDTEPIHQGDMLFVEIGSHQIYNETTGERLDIHPLPKVMVDILLSGGLENYFKTHKGFDL